MTDFEKPQEKEISKKKELDITITGVDIDKNEYHEIVLSNSNFPERDFCKNYYD